MKKLNPNKLSVKDMEKIRLKAAFSQFVDSLKVWRKGCSGNCWQCCDTVFVSLAQLHKHISCNHLDVVKKYYGCLEEKTVQSKSVKISSFFSAPTTEKITCNCCVKNFVVILFYHYVKIEYDLHLISEWQVSIKRFKMSLMGYIFWCSGRKNMFSVVHKIICVHILYSILNGTQ